MAIKRTQTDAEDLKQLKAIVAEQQTRLELLENKNDETPNGEGVEKKSTRRQLLKLAGAGLMGAAGAAALKAVPAAAADGDAVLVGSFRFETAGFNTAIDQTNAVETYPGIWAAYGTTNSIGFYGTVGDFGHGVLARASGVYGTGVYGYGRWGGVFIDAGGGGGSGVVADSFVNNGQGVFAYSGATNGRGVWASGATGVAAYGTHTNSAAIYGYTSATGSLGARLTSTRGSGLIVRSSNAFGTLSYGAIGSMSFGYGNGLSAMTGISFGGGPDVKLAGTGRMVQYNSITGGVYGAPTYTPAYGYFELIRDTYGTMWANRPTAGGTYTGQNAWKRINAVRVDASDGTGVAYKPYRAVDTRFASPGPQGTLQDDTFHTYTLAGAGAGLQKIPSTAVAVIGNLTATGFTSSGGFLAIHPKGQAFDKVHDPSSLNFSGTAGAWANSFVCGLGTGADAGKVELYVKCYNSGHTNVIIDITGYIE